MNESLVWAQKKKNNFMNQHQSEKTLQTIKPTLNYDWMSNNQQHCKIANIKAHVTALQFNISNLIWQVSLSSLTSFNFF